MSIVIVINSTIDFPEKVNLNVILFKILRFFEVLVSDVRKIHEISIPYLPCSVVIL